MNEKRSIESSKKEDVKLANYLRGEQKIEEQKLKGYIKIFRDFSRELERQEEEKEQKIETRIKELKKEEVKHYYLGTALAGLGAISLTISNTTIIIVNLPLLAHLSLLSSYILFGLAALEVYKGFKIWIETELITLRIEIQKEFRRTLATYALNILNEQHQGGKEGLDSKKSEESNKT